MESQVEAGRAKAIGLSNNFTNNTIIESKVLCLYLLCQQSKHATQSMAS